MKTEKNVALRIYSLGKLVNKLMDTALRTRAVQQFKCLTMENHRSNKKA